MPDYGPQTLAADQLHGMKHRERGEDFREAMNRVAFGLKESDQHYKDLRQILEPYLVIDKFIKNYILIKVKKLTLNIKIN